MSCHTPQVHYPVIKTTRNQNVKPTWRAPGEEKLAVARGPTGFLEGYAMLRDSCGRVVWWDTFEGFMTICIVLNTVLLACEYHGQPQYWTDTLEICNWILTAIFTLEMLLKFLGLGIRNYFSDLFNWFDGGVVVLSLVEIIIAVAGSSNSKSGVSAFRSLRLIRVMRSMKVGLGGGSLAADLARALSPLPRSAGWGRWPWCGPYEGAVVVGGGRTAGGEGLGPSG